MIGRRIQNRIIRFEIATLSQGRWVIESLRDDEAEAVELARTLLASEKYEAVRVVRERSMLDGFTTAKPVYEERFLPRGKTSLKLSAGGEESTWCETLEDFLGSASRRAIGNLLRSFLDHHGITVMELLHDYRWIKKIDAADGLKSAALHRVVRQRAEESGESMTACRARLDGLIAEATTRARDLMASRALPRMLDEGLDALVAACRLAAPDAPQQEHLMRFAICRFIEPRQGLMDRLAALANIAMPASDPLAHRLFDSFAADCLASGTVLQDLLGRQAHLGQALVAIAELAAGRMDKVRPGLPPLAGMVGRMIAERESSDMRAVLADRIARALAGEQRLTRGDPRAEAGALGLLCERMQDADGGFPGGPAMVRALARRFSRLDLPGGLEEIRLRPGSTAERIEQLLLLERTAFSDIKKRAIATLLLDLLRRAGTEERVTLRALGRSVANSGLPAATRQRFAEATGT
ncbi:MAG: hypothetical protein KIT81_13580 [Alphaproteobacteria bacterium]|nr:hypothetical protein [Alphaproteobacteria bacterium]